MNEKNPINQSISVSLALILTLVSFSSTVITAQKAVAQVVVGLTGTVEWKPQGGTRFNPVSRNMTLPQGSLLRLNQGANVTLSCPDGRSRSLTTQGTSGLSQICPPARTVSGRIITPRNGARDIPYAILPRATAILSNQPVLRWNAAIGANRFRVIVRGQGLEWIKEVSKNGICSEQVCQLVYSGDPALQPGISYRLVIEADNGRKSSEETTAGLGFRLLDATEASEVNQSVESIRAQNLPDVSEVLALANVYTSYNLVAGAIQALEAISPSEKTAEVHRQMGDLYRGIGLPLEAEVQYREAIELAEANNNRLELAAAQTGLGEVNYTLGRRGEAAQLLQAAKTVYEELGDAERVTELEQRLAQVQS